MDTLLGYNTGSDSDDTSSSSSLDSAGLRAAQAEARLKDFGEDEEERGAAKSSLLPPAFSAFDQVEGPPDFLDPESTRPLLGSASLARSGLAASGEGAQKGGGGGGRMKPGPGFDISVLAPKLKGHKRPVDSRDMPAGALIEGKAKRYRDEDGPEATQQYSATTIALLGGKVAGGAPEKQPAAGAAASRGPATKPMEVSEFLNKGIGAAALPRRAQDRKDKEKEKRSKGQSAIGSWKTEAEMVLRQQYDS
ncbi:hypothetical protein CEUSTIGMA_g12339.t1 [Chlamydomonas eustigma]|uniref:Uncharacterized protein n=1 Tax=Chlamydomonas eustigma TaxID=1157962 RepID=A0A250XPD5_9CHLO|nr:hypothetical protein CEUSTIGMA_g12339.t1 [Chlamydomonas eustigma]|eukprot:GAX84918.1 hypothetical protein CEUSTIGMA_g12339.t1 [Chlamydomonas eustigma]